MANNRTQRFGPTLMVTGATGSNYITPANAGTGATGYTPSASYILLRQISIVNITTGAVTYSLFIGGTTGSASGTSFAGSSKSIAANGREDIPCGYLRLENGDFLSGTASAVNALVLTAMGEVGLT